MKTSAFYSRVARNGGILDANKYRYIIDSDGCLKRTLLSNLDTTAMLEPDVWQIVEIPGPTKSDLARIIVTDYERFTLDGVDYWAGLPDRITRSKTDYIKYTGFSPRGIWTDFTNGFYRFRIYKGDLYAVNPDGAVALFNGTLGK